MLEGLCSVILVKDLERMKALQPLRGATTMCHPSGGIASLETTFTRLDRGNMGNDVSWTERIHG